MIKEFSSRLGGGAAAVFGNWSVYVLITAGAASLLLASHALAAGPLAASQPGFTIVDPLAASLLGLFLFGERMRSGMIDLAGEAAGLALLVVGVSVLSHSQLIHGGDEPPPQAARPSPRGASPSAAARMLTGTPARRRHAPLPRGRPALVARIRERQARPGLDLAAR